MSRLLGVAVLLFGTLLLPVTTSADWTVERPNEAIVAEGTAKVIGDADYLPPKLDMTLVSSGGDIIDAYNLVDRITFIFYYSATCPHCQHVAPEVAKLAERLQPNVGFVGIGSGGNSVGELAEFTKTYGLPFESYKDYTRRFARDNRATSTPQLLLVRPKGEGAFETLGEWRPLAGGIAVLAEVRALAALGQDPFGAFREGEYHGSNACGGCHQQELRSWGLTHHSIAYWTLYEREETDKAECVSCHVTGLGEPGGFVLGEHQSHLAEVSCESCHGAGGPHVPGLAASAKAARDTCVGCHDQDHSVRFSLERALPHVNHFLPAASDPEAFRLAREALVDGKAPRPLTAFPEGTNLGNDACVECHQSESKSFRKDPHATAMKTLKARSSNKDMACIGCHAVEKVTPPKTPKDFHQDGVGCEACHGPGEQHVAAKGGTENIVGLGDSCPVCVVEAICTRCHTPEQDSDWNLEEALKKVGHK